MEQITEKDLAFIVALNASEEASIIELKQDIKKWDYHSLDVAEIIKSLVQDGTVLFTKLKDNAFSNYNLIESCNIAASWDACEKSRETIIFLTEQGLARWQVDDWGISTERARKLMFTNANGISRVG